MESAVDYENEYADEEVEFNSPRKMGPLAGYQGEQEYEDSFDREEQFYDPG